MNDNKNISSTIIDRIAKLSIVLETEHARLLQWVFLRTIISAQWFIEDNGDPSNKLTLEKHVHPLLN